jgi:hypothetical protein
MPHSRSHSRKSRRHSRNRSRSRSGAKSRHHSRRHSRSRSRSGANSRHNSRRHSRSRSRSGAKAHKTIYPPKGISQGRAKRLVYDGVYKKTRGGLTKSDLTENKYGKVVSIRKSKAGKSLQRRHPYKKNKDFMKYAGKI